MSTNYDHPFDICVWSRFDDVVISSQLMVLGHWEPQRVRDMIRAMRLFAQPVVLDVGANLGIFTLATAVAGASRVFAFEPIPAHVALIAASLRRNAIDSNRVRLVAAGASNRTGGARMLMNTSNRGGSSFLAAKHRIEGAKDVRAIDCNVTTIDSVVRERVHVMKVDVEGFESCVIDGAKQLIERHGVCFLFLEYWFTLRPCGARNATVAEDLFALGFEAYRSFDDFAQGLGALDNGMINAMSNTALPVLDLLFWKPGCSPRPPPMVVTLAPGIVQHLDAMVHKFRIVSVVKFNAELDLVFGRNAASELVSKSTFELTADEVDLFLQFKRQHSNDQLMPDAQILQNAQVQKI